MSSYIPSKVELKPKRHHGYAVLLFVLGTLFPPLAVAARFGIGKDFWLNLLLTLCGYFPGHGHNFYIQNIRNNKSHARTPKWAQRYGLVDTSEIKRKERKSQWANRYNDRLPSSTLENQPYEDGQERGSSVDIALDANDNHKRQPNGELWHREDETYYNPDKSSGPSSSGRWHYPANFDDVEAVPAKPKKKKDKKDRWERTQDAYSMTGEGDSSQIKKKKKKKRKSTDGDSSNTAHDSTEYPEDPEGGLYGSRPNLSVKSINKDKTSEEVFDHQF